MICPYCDSLITTVPENGCCPNCCAPLGVAAQEKENGFPDAPLGVYGGADGDSLEIGKNSVIIRKSNPILKTKSVFELRYEELTGVFFNWAGNNQSGGLCIRSQMSAQTPCSFDARDATAVSFLTEGNMIFWHVYEFLQKCVNVAKERPKEQSAAFAQAPLGTYKGIGGQLELTADSVIFTKKVSQSFQSCYTLAYDKLYDVSFRLPTFWTNGRLWVKCWENRHTVYTFFEDNETSLVFTAEEQESFQKVYTFLKACCKKETEQ